jgi:2-amino-4-hydroxy-6-hydroxymethyldihydropteridine diphosphokinase
MNESFLCLGGNVNDVFETFKKTQTLLSELNIEILKKSSIYKTAPWGNTHQPDFFNQVIQIHTTLNAHELMNICLNVETKLGRNRSLETHWGQRIIDIDMLLFNNSIINNTNTIIPHPRMLQRNFVMVPLAEIAGNYIHPVALKKINELVKFTNDTLPTIKL